MLAILKTEQVENSGSLSSKEVITPRQHAGIDQKPVSLGPTNHRSIVSPRVTNIRLELPYAERSKANSHSLVVRLKKGQNMRPGDTKIG